MVGKWVEESDGDCKLAQDFKADGKVEGFFESWTLEGSNLVVGVMGETQIMAVKMVDPKSIDIEMGGKTKRLIRCWIAVSPCTGGAKGSTLRTGSRHLPTRGRGRA